MDIQHGILRRALAPLAHMTISRKDIFLHIPETELWTLLVVLPLDLGVAYLLDIELCHFDRCPAHGQDACAPNGSFSDGLPLCAAQKVRASLIRFFLLEETALAIAGLGGCGLARRYRSAGRQQCPDVRSRLHLCFKEHSSAQS